MFVPVIPAGTDAPGFELPGLIDGAHRRVALDEFVGKDVVILAFYPADFNPACDAESDLDELDLFTMQKDVEVLAIGPDTLYSHAAFADEYDLHIPLLSDADHEVAETYGVAFEDEVGQRLIERAVFVVDHDGVIQYVWSTRDMEGRPRIEEIKDAIADTGGDDTAFARYRVGHAHYTEGRRAFTSAMASYRDSEWMVAQSDFKRAREEFEEAAEHFDSAARFVDDETFEVYYERTQEKATALWQAADWLSKSASEYSSGRGAEGQRLRDDAERPLKNAHDLGEPVDPDEWPPDEDDDEHESILPQKDDRDSALTVDIDDEVAENGIVDAADGVESGPGYGDGTGDDADEDGSTSADGIDEEDLKELEAEMEASQSAAEAASQDVSRGEAGEAVPADGSAGDSPGDGVETGDALESTGDPAVSDGHEQTAGGDADGSTDGVAEDDEPVLDEAPQGATDEDLVDIPTAEDLAGEVDESDDAEDDEHGGGY